MSASTAKLAVIGWPVGHSLSPVIHNHWIKVHGIDATYTKLPVKPEDLGDFLGSAAANGYRGLNITLPHKTAALQIIAELGGDIDQVARIIGAINTVMFDQHGVASATNTDAAGFIADLTNRAPNWRPDAGPDAGHVLVLGAGGAARAIVVALKDAGVADICISNRTGSKADALAAELGRGEVRSVPWQDRGSIAAKVGLVVNATSLGLAGAGPLEFDVDVLGEGAVVYDLVYGVTDTPLVTDARARGLSAHGGLGMLCRQAALSFERWFGVLPEVDDALLSSLQQHMKNTKD